MKKVTTLLSTLALATTLAAQNLPQTERQYLSGHGCDDMVEWDFFCTNGRNSGKWTKIGVPSCWELQGFGTYQYGITFYGKPFPEGVADEKGMYKYEFEVPEKFRGKQVNLVFEASMTGHDPRKNPRNVAHAALFGQLDTIDDAAPIDAFPALREPEKGGNHLFAAGDALFLSLEHDLYALHIGDEIELAR